MAIQGMIELFENLDEDEANAYGLVLTSHGLPYTVRRTSGGWQIWVPEEVHDSAVHSIEAYLSENPQREPFSEAPAEPGPIRTSSGIWVSLLLAALYAVMNAGGRSDGWTSQYGASAEKILSGEIFRAVTALTLHGDFLHLSGNALGLAIFGTALCNIAGSGLGWLMILSAGALGNLVNAWMFETGHLSIGASTSVFGAIGALAAIQYDRRSRFPGRRLRAWLPLAAGLALLALLGSGPNSDLTAHLFGFLWGILLGWTYSRHIRTAPGKNAQKQMLMLCIGMLAVCWLWPFL